MPKQELRFRINLTISNPQLKCVTEKETVIAVWPDEIVAVLSMEIGEKKFPKLMMSSGIELDVVGSWEDTVTRVREAKS